MDGKTKELISSKRINFLSVFKKNWLNFIFAFFSGTIGVLIKGFLDQTTDCFVTQISKHSSENFVDFISFKVRSFFSLTFITKWHFCLLVISAVLFYCIFKALHNYFNYLLRFNCNFSLSLEILDKFRNLNPVQAKKNKDLVYKILEGDVGDFAKLWARIFFDVVLNLFTLFLTLYLDIKIFQQMNLFSLFLITIFFIFYIGVSIIFLELEKNLFKKNRKFEDEEARILSKETGNRLLIESSGLTDEYRQKHINFYKKYYPFILSREKIKSFGEIIPFDFLLYIFPYLLLLLVSNKYIIIIFAFHRMLNSVWGIVKIMRNYKKYSIAKFRVNYFFSLPEKRTNPSGIRFPSGEKITSVVFTGVSFGYSKGKPILRNYNNTFSIGRVNFIEGANGSGKSTIVSLLLGIIQPEEGQILINTTNEQYDLKIFELEYYRKHTTAFVSHQTLLDEGSTGQKQLTNIGLTFQRKPDAKIWIFDEAVNALDIDNQNVVSSWINELVKKGILVLAIKHRTV